MGGHKQHHNFSKTSDKLVAVNVEQPTEKASEETKDKDKGQADNTEHNDQPVKGVIFFVVFTFIKALSYVVTKILYDREPNLQPFPMLFMRSVFGILIMAGMMNAKLKRDTWDSVTRDKVGSLLFKTLASSCTNII